MGFHRRIPGSKALWVLKVAKLQAMYSMLGVMLSTTADSSMGSRIWNRAMAVPETHFKYSVRDGRFFVGIKIPFMP